MRLPEEKRQDLHFSRLYVGETRQVQVLPTLSYFTSEKRFTWSPWFISMFPSLVYLRWTRTPAVRCVVCCKSSSGSDRCVCITSLWPWLKAAAFTVSTRSTRSRSLGWGTLEGWNVVFIVGWLKAHCIFEFCSALWSGAFTAGWASHVVSAYNVQWNLDRMRFNDT